MKQITLFLLSIILLSSFASIKPDNRLIDYLDAEKVAILQKSNPSLIHYYNFFLDNSYTISDLPADKFEGNNFNELDLPLINGKVDTKKLNVLKLEIQRKYEEDIYFKVKGQNTIFIMLSEKKFMEKYNKYRKQNGLMK